MSSSLKTHVISHKCQQDKSKIDRDPSGKPHTKNRPFSTPKTLNNMNHICLKGTMEKVDSGETLVKPNNFNHINEVGLTHVKLSHSDNCRPSLLCLRRLRSLGHLWCLFSQVPDLISHIAWCSKKLPQIRLVASRALGAQVSFDRHCSVDVLQHLREFFLSGNHDILWKKLMPHVRHMSLKQSKYKDKARVMTNGPTPVSKDNWAA